MNLFKWNLIIFLTNLEKFGHLKKVNRNNKSHNYTYLRQFIYVSLCKMNKYIHINMVL